MADLTKLDAAGLQAFIDGDLTTFYQDILALRSAGQNPPSLYDTAASPAPLTLGQMNGDTDTGGKGVVANAQTAAGAIDAVLNKHQTAFADLKIELNDVITTMLQTQDDSLTSIDGQKFLSAIDGYDGDIGGGGTTTTTVPTTTTTTVTA
jgi:hypothetical protein